MTVAALLLLAALQSAPVIENPPEVAPPIGAYSHVATVPPGSELLVLAGQVGIGPDGKVASGAEAQYEAALRNIAALLKSKGASPRQLVKVNTYLVQPIPPQRMQAIREAVFGDAVPPSTLVYVVRLARPDLLVEVEAMAIRPR